MSQMPPCPSIFHGLLRVYHTRHLWDTLKSDESRQIPPRRASLEDGTASNDFIGSSPQGSSVRGKLMERERSRARETEGGREREEGSVQKNERKRSLYARVCLVVTRGASIQPVARLSPTHSFIHTRCTRFESISKPRKRISPIGLLSRVNRVRPRYPLLSYAAVSLLRRAQRFLRGGTSSKRRQKFGNFLS